MMNYGKKTTQRQDFDLKVARLRREGVDERTLSAVEALFLATVHEDHAIEDVIPLFRERCTFARDLSPSPGSALREVFQELGVTVLKDAPSP